MDAYGGDYIQDVILGLDGKKSKMTLNTMHLNVINGRSVPNLPADCVLELAVNLSRKGARPVKNKPLDTYLWGVISPLVAIVELSVQAAVNRDKHAFMQALHLDPLVHEFNSIPKLAEGLWKINEPFKKAVK